MRLMIGAGTPKEAIARGNEVSLLVPLANGSVLLLLAAIASNYTFILAIIPWSQGSLRTGS